MWRRRARKFGHRVVALFSGKRSLRYRCALPCGMPAGTDEQNVGFRIVRARGGLTICAPTYNNKGVMLNMTIGFGLPFSAEQRSVFACGFLDAPV
eukprot:5503903-Pyramimonas_sp.AAC.1